MKKHLKGIDPCSLHTAATAIKEEIQAIAPPNAPWPLMPKEHCYQVVAYHHFENGFDDKLDFHTLEEAETAAQGYVNGTMEPDGFRYDGAAVFDKRERKYLRVYGDYPDEKAHEQVNGIEPPDYRTDAERFIFMRGYAQALEDLAQLQLDTIDKKMEQQGLDVTLHEEDFFFAKDKRFDEWDDNTIALELIQTDNIWRRLIHECCAQEIGPDDLSKIISARIWVACTADDGSSNCIHALIEFREQGYTLSDDLDFALTDAERLALHRVLNRWAKENYLLDTIEEYANAYVFREGGPYA